jgi:hypothetical protein
MASCADDAALFASCFPWCSLTVLCVMDAGKGAFPPAASREGRVDGRATFSQVPSEPCAAIHFEVTPGCSAYVAGWLSARGGGECGLQLP